MELVMIVAVSRNGIIGIEGRIPWHIPEDLRRFKQLTAGHPVIMGRKTYESILHSLGKPLPERLNVVLSRNTSVSYSGVRIFPSLEYALTELQQGNPTQEGITYDKTFVIGGETVYREALPKADRLEITRVHDSFFGDAHFPELSLVEWEEVTCTGNERYSFHTYLRRKR